ncbi:MAG: hypothetical protein KDF58_10070 [Alphaproteobacteria bacterium]|nr:hypothetical protein [Alphaproteobacteria bacterium]
MLSRLLAYIFLSLTVITLGAEFLRYLEGNEQGLISIAHVMNFMEAIKGTHLASADSPDNGQAMLSPVLKLPIIMPFGVITMLLFLKNR